MADAEAAEIVRLHKEGLSEAQIVKQLGATRHAVRTAVERAAVYEEGRQAGLKEAEARQKSVAMHPSAGSYGLPPDQSAFNEELLAEIVAALTENRRVPERELRAKFGVTPNVFYKYRGIAIDRVQCRRGV